MMTLLAPTSAARPWQVVVHHPVPCLPKRCLGEVGVCPGVQPSPTTTPTAPMGTPLVLVPQRLGRLQVNLRQGLLLHTA